MWAVDKAQDLFKQKAASDFACVNLPHDAAKGVQTWAASMPRWEPRLNKVLGVEEFVTRHARTTTGADWPMETDNNRAMSVYLHYLANGTRSGSNHQRGVQGGDRTRQGTCQPQARRTQLACTDCHGKSANHWIRGQWLGEPKGQYDHFPTWRTSLLAIWDIRSASSGARSISAPTNCRPTPRNTAIWNSFSHRK